jgi:CoA:oxalate CoA-transferase
VINNYRPGAMDRMGLGRAALKALKPDRVSAHVTGFGLAGPYADRPSFDSIAQAMSGLMSVIPALVGWQRSCSPR